MKLVVIDVEELSEMIDLKLDERLNPILKSIESLKEVKIYTVREIAEILHKSKTTIYKYCVDGTINAKPKGRSFIITHQALLDYSNPTK